MKQLLITIAAVVLVGCGAKRNMQWANVKMEPVHALASDLSKATICEVYRGDDSYPKEQKIQNGGNLHGYTVISMQFHYQNNLETFYPGF